VRFNDAVIGIALLALAGAMVWLTRGFPPMPGQKYGPALFPVLIASGLAVCALLLIIRGWRERRHVRLLALAPWARDPRRVGGVSIVLACILAYILLSEPVGFFIVAGGILLLLLMSSGLAWSRAVPIAIAVTIAIHVSFYSVLRVPLPWGVLTPMAW
jgi:putative tricarboxylic transport membrane protein